MERASKRPRQRHRRDELQRHRRDELGRFTGARINVEDIPRLPTFAARWALEDARGRPYIVVWEPRGFLAGHALRMEPTDRSNTVRVISETGGTTELELEWRAMPRGTGHVLFYRCPGCKQPRRY